VDEVGGNHFVVGVGEDAFEVGLGRLFEGGFDFREGGFLLGLYGEVHCRDSRGGHAEGHAGELAFDRRADERDGLGCARGGRDDVDRSAAATFPILLGWAIHGFLGGGVGVNGGHQTFLDAEAFLEEDVDDRGKAIGGAACV